MNMYLNPSDEDIRANWEIAQLSFKITNGSTNGKIQNLIKQNVVLGNLIHNDEEFQQIIEGFDLLLLYFILLNL